MATITTDEKPSVGQEEKPHEITKSAEVMQAEASLPPTQSSAHITFRDFWDNRRVLMFCESLIPVHLLPVPPSHGTIIA